MSLAELKAALSQASNLSQFKGLSAAYGTLLAGIPSLDGYLYLIKNNNDTNFGAGPGPLFNDENIIINTLNALYQGNDIARAAFDLIIGGGLGGTDALTAVYNFVIPPSSQSAEGLAYFKLQEGFYAARAIELGIPGATGTAVVAFAALTKIAVDNGVGGLGDTLNDLIGAVNNGTAVIPQSATVLTDIEVADGTQFDANDVPTSNTAPVYSITASPSSVTEGNTGLGATITYTLSRTGDVSKAGSVSITYLGTAGGADFDASIRQLVSFAAGASTATLTVTVEPDTQVEPNETVTVLLGLVGGGGSVGLAKSATATIVNDDGGTVYTIEVDASSIAEGNGGIGNTLTYTVVRTGDVSSPGSVGVTFGGTASLGVDYTSAALSGGVVSFAAGEDRKSITITTSPDLGSELNETVRASLGAITVGGGTLGTTSSATATITNDDTAPLNTFYSIAVSPTSITEGNSGPGGVIAYTITRTGDTSEAGAVNVILQGTANAQIDYSLPFFGSVVSFAAGQTEVIYNLTVRPDTTSEADETVTVSLDSFPHGAQLSDPSSATAVIVNDDPASPSPLQGLLIGVVDMTTQFEPAGF